MNTRKMVLFIAAALLINLPAAAQSPSDAEMRAVEQREADVEQRLRDAEARLAEAARQVAELSTQRLPHRARIEKRIEIIDTGRPRLGVTIGGDDEADPVEGVGILGVTPGSAASEAGLRAGDVITSVNGESLSAENSEQANRKLLDFMAGVEEGDVIDVEYLRDGKVGTVVVEPQPVDRNFFAFGGDNMHVPGLPHMPMAPGVIDGLRDRFAFSWSGNSWGDMELVELSPGLGKYFGTDSGLLVVSAPSSDAFKLEDGDVIQKIDGRSPTSVRHAMRILSSYQAGEKLKLEIMRDKKRRTLDIEIPDERSSRVLPHPPPVRPARAPAPPRPAFNLEKS